MALKKNPSSRTGRVLVIDDDFTIREACREALVRAGHEVEMADGGHSGLDLLRHWAFDVILLDLRMPDLDGMSVLRKIREQETDAQVIIISAHGSIPRVVEAVKLGAFDFLPKPFNPNELRLAVDNALKQRRLTLENVFLKEELSKKAAPPRLIGSSRAIKKVKDLADRAAVTDSTVLITGESGSGKGLMARRLHEKSPRSQAPFVAVDCSVLVPTLFESELFGHVKGAFTGADSSKVGKFELSHGGTLFFDEIGNISLDIQAKLLHAVEERAICRVGSHRVIKVDTRLVAATNQDLPRAVKAGRFREDLFHRINVVHMHLPPLRERAEDVPELADYFLDRLRETGETELTGFSSGALAALAALPWPGNVRELENRVRRLVILSDGPRISEADVAASSGLSLDSGPAESEGLSLAEVESRHIKRSLAKFGGNRTQTASALGIDRKTLRDKIKKYDLEA